MRSASCFLFATLAAGFGLLALPNFAFAQEPGSGQIAVAGLPEAPRPQFEVAAIEPPAQQTPSGQSQTTPQGNASSQAPVPHLNETASRSDVVSLTASQKLNLAFRSATSPFAFGKPFLVAGYHEALDEDVGFGWGAEGYGRRVGVAYLNSLNGTIIGSGILTSVLHQDPRYFRLGYGTVRHRGLYAVANVFICQHDGTRKWEPNYSNLGGSLIAAAISNAYYPSDETSAGQVISRGMSSIAWSAVGPVFHEFWPDVSRKILHRDPTHGLDAQARAADQARKQAREEQK
jgi:hypothetical protein